MNKNTFFALIIVLICTTGLSAHNAVRSAGLMSWEWDSGDISFPDSGENNRHFYGLESEYIHSHLGYGMDVLISFEDSDRLDWQGQLFMRYHLFGVHTFLDPFAEAGIGNAGSVDLKNGDDLKLNLYPFISAGLNLVFAEGFYIGSRWSYRLDEWEIPGTGYLTPDLTRFQMSILIGISHDWHNSHKLRDQENHYHYYFD